MGEHADRCVWGWVAVHRNGWMDRQMEYIWGWKEMFEYLIYEEITVGGYRVCIWNTRGTGSLVSLSLSQVKSDHVGHDHPLNRRR